MRNISSRLFSTIQNGRKARNINTSACLRDTAYDGPGKTTATVLNVIHHDSIIINECNPNGFLLNNSKMIIGPMAIFPKTVLSWNVDVGGSIDEESLSLFLHLEPRPDLLVIGLEKQYEYSEVRRIREILRKAKIASEVLPVKQACAIFNFGSYEGRYIAGGLIPPISKYDYWKPRDDSKTTESKRHLESGT